MKVAETKKNHWKENTLIEFLSGFARDVAWVFLLMVGLRLAELWILNHEHLLELPFGRSFFISLESDFVFTWGFSTLLAIPLLGLWKWKKRVGIITSRLLLWSVLLLQILLTEYFLIKLELLDMQLFRFSFGGNLHIVSHEIWEKPFYHYLLLAFFGFASAYLLFKKRRDYSESIRLSMVPVFFLLSIIAFGNLKWLRPSMNPFPTLTEYWLGHNKAGYLGYTWWESRKQGKKKLDPNQLKQAIDSYQSARGYQFTGEEYPLLHQTPYPNVLGPYFQKGNTRPNVVLLLCEGLSRTLSGPDARWGSYSSFLDSLSGSGLYFANFLSHSTQTNGIFSNLLASLPYGDENGITSMGKRIPFHRSIYSELRANNYRMGFYYGGWIGFDGMSSFFKWQQVDEIIDDQSYQGVYAIPSAYQKTEWGYTDRILFEEYFRRNPTLSNQPYVQTLLTLSFHHPFTLELPDPYRRELEQRVDQIKLREREGEPAHKRDRRIKITEKHPEIFTCALFADDALKYFFEEYRRRPDFDSTIFVVVGDHNFAGLELLNGLRARHVPLLIWSPLMRRSKVIRGVSLHNDVLPSLLSLLEENFGLHTSSGAHWMGEGLDTSGTWRCLRSLPLQKLGQPHCEYLHYETFLSCDQELYTVDSLFRTQRLDSMALKEELKLRVRSYQVLNRYVTENNKVLKRK